MDTLSDTVITQPEPLLTEADQAALHDEVLRCLGTLPFQPGAPISRSLWLIFISRWGLQTRAAVPVDDELDLPDRVNIAGLCDLVAGFLEHATADETALVVLRRPGTAGISQADEYIFRVLCDAAAHRDTAPWAFYVAAPDGIWELTGARTLSCRTGYVQHSGVRERLAELMRRSLDPGLLGFTSPPVLGIAPQARYRCRGSPNFLRPDVGLAVLGHCYVPVRAVSLSPARFSYVEGRFGRAVSGGQVEHDVQPGS
jgi:hypothetical protein